MAFSLRATLGNTTISLTDGNPFSLEAAEGFGNSPVLRHTQGGPLQGGDTDVGYRLSPRVAVLRLTFHAANDAQLDMYRDLLLSVFKPLDAAAITLTATRDDGGERTLRCYCIGDLVIDLVPEDRAGRLHRATVVVRAPDPLWQSTNAISLSWDDAWYLANGAISANNELLHQRQGGPKSVKTFPPQSDWAVAFVTTQDTGAGHYVFGDRGTAQLFGTAGAYFFNDQTNGGAGYAWPGGSARNYHVIRSLAGSAGYSEWRYWDGSALVQHATGGTGVVLDQPVNFGADGFDRLDSKWGQPITKILLWRNVTESQMEALVPHMLGDVVAVNRGNDPAYPTIRIGGMVANPVITNLSTGARIDLTGLTVQSGDIVTISLEGGDKSIVNANGDSVLDMPTTPPLHMMDFAIAPSPVVTGGTNLLALTYSSIGTAATFSVEFTERYVSF